MYIACLIIGGIDSSDLLACKTITLVRMGAKVTHLIRYNYQIWRFITPMFLHTSLTHILSNTLSILVLG